MACVMTRPVVPLSLLVVRDAATGRAMGGQDTAARAVSRPLPRRRRHPVYPRRALGDRPPAAAAQRRGGATPMCILEEPGLIVAGIDHGLGSPRHRRSGGERR